MSSSVFVSLSTLKALLQQIIFISSRTVLLVLNDKIHKLPVDNLCTLLVTLSVQHNIYKSQIVLSHFCAVHGIAPCFSKIQYNILIPICVFSKQSVPSGFPI